MPVFPFAHVGPALYTLGYNPIPITPGDKKPGVMIDGSWRLFRGWNQYCVSRPSQFQIDQWAKYPHAGVGVACGQGLICIDIDLEDAVGPLLEILPYSNVQKKGRKGVSLFYRGNTEVIRSKNFRTPAPDRVGLVDLLAEGKQTVLPPSIHPDTEEPYVWLTPDTLLNTPLEDLTELDDDIADQIAEVLREFGFNPDVERRCESCSETSVSLIQHSSAASLFKQANDAALANLSAWVPKLGLKRLYHAGSGFKAVAEWRSSSSGRPLHKRSPNLSFSSDGIRDFGAGRGYTPVDVVMEARRVPASEALDWLALRVEVTLSDPVASALAERILAAAAKRNDLTQ